MELSLIALDMDGTLMDDSHIQVSPRNRSALERCALAGIELVLASGRPLALMVETARSLGVRYVISANGAAIWDLKQDRRMMDRAIPPEQAGPILSILTSYPIPAEAYSGGRAHVDARTWKLEGYAKQPGEFLSYRAARNAVEPDLCRALYGKAVEKFNVDNLPRATCDAILAQLAPYRAGLAINYIACYDNLEISRADATKGAALSWLCDTLGVPPSRVMAFGDSDNDADMLRWAGWSFAMGNAEPAALAAARYQTASNTQDGVAQAIERYVT